MCVTVKTGHSGTFQSANTSEWNDCQGKQTPATAETADASTAVLRTVIKLMKHGLTKRNDT